MDGKFSNKLNDLLKNSKETNEKELEKELQDFMKEYNNGELNYIKTAKDEAYDLLESAQYAKTKKQALVLAKKAYDKCPKCLDVLLFLADLEDNSIKRDELIEKGLDAEKKELEKEKYFTKDYIGIFYGLLETRPYIRGLHRKLKYLLVDGKIKQAKALCKEILRLNNNDNLGARYLLMAIYAVLEEENEMMSLYKKYPEENLEMLFPQFVLYYKSGQDKKAKQLLKRVNKANPYLVKLYNGKLKNDDKAPKGYFSMGGSSEIIMYYDNYDFLLSTIPNISDYVLENSKEV